MFQRKPVLPGTSDSDQLTKIFQLCGSPSEENFPGWNRFDPKQEFAPFWTYSPRRVQSVLPEQYVLFLPSTQAKMLADHDLEIKESPLKPSTS